MLRFFAGFSSTFKAILFKVNTNRSRLEGKKVLFSIDMLCFGILFMYKTLGLISGDYSTSFSTRINSSSTCMASDLVFMLFMIIKNGVPSFFE